MQQVKRGSFEGSPEPQVPGSRPFLVENDTLQRVQVQLAGEEDGGRKHMVSDCHGDQDGLCLVPAHSGSGAGRKGLSMLRMRKGVLESFSKLPKWPVILSEEQHIEGCSQMRRRVGRAGWEPEDTYLVQSGWGRQTQGVAS